MTHQPDPVDESGSLKTPRVIPSITDLWFAATQLTALHDALEQLTREAKSNAITADSLRRAEEVLSIVRREVA